MTEGIIDFFIFFGALFTAIIGLGQIVVKQRTTLTYIYSFTFVGLGLWIFQWGLVTTGFFDQFWWAYYLKIALIPVVFITPSLMAIRYNWLITGKFSIKSHYVLLFIPSLITLGVLLIPAVTDSIVVKREFLFVKPVLSESFFSMPLYYQIVYSLFIIPNMLIVLFMSPILARMSVIWKKDHPGGRKKHNAARIGYIFAAVIVSTNILGIAGALCSITLLKIVIILISMSVCVLYLVTQRQPDYARLLKIETRKAYYERSRIRGLDVEGITDRLLELMEDEKIYTDEELSLKDLAGELGISPHQLSQLLNEKIGMNFNAFINDFRVKDAKQLLLEEPDRSILSIGIAVGFNSTTTFNTAFAKIVGVSPGQYRKTHLPKGRG